MTLTMLMSILILLLNLYYSFAKPGYLNYTDFKGKPYSVGYNNRSLLIDGQPSLFISGSLHYPRFAEGAWEDLFKKAQIEGLNLIQLYIFWNYHEEYEGTYRWDGNANITRFIELAGQYNFFVNLRLGPFVCAEWNLGGLPTWLFLKKNCQLRGNNDCFKSNMKKWLEVAISKVRHLFADHGGPIILSQIENEMQWDDQGYLDFCSNLVDEFALGVPFGMCQGRSAHNTISTCNLADCTDFIEKNGESGRILIDHPAIWTENEAWYSMWGEYYPDFESRHGSLFPARTAEEHAYSVLRWFARGGSYMNYYMLIGGNNFGIWSGGAVVTMFTDYSNYFSDGIVNEPKHTHLLNLNKVIMQVSEILINNLAQKDNAVKVKYWDGSKYIFGTEQIAFIYNYTTDSVAFIENLSSKSLYILFNDKEMFMAANSMLLYDINNNKLLYNTSNTDYSYLKYKQYHDIEDKPINWQVWKERSLSKPIEPLAGIDVIHAKSPWGQLEITEGHTEYLYYEVNISFTFKNCFTSIGGHIGNAYTFYIDGNFSAEVSDRTHFHGPSFPSLTLRNPSGLHRATVLSETLGIDNTLMPNIPIAIGYGLNTLVTCGLIVTNYNWIMRPYLDGQLLKVYTDEGMKQVEWREYQSSDITGGIWYKTTFETPKLTFDDQLEIDLLGMCRGHLYVNGYDLGRYFLIFGKDMDHPTQRYYFIPKEWLKYDGSLNTLMLVEICGDVDPLRPRLKIVNAQ